MEEATERVEPSAGCMRSEFEDIIQPEYVQLGGAKLEPVEALAETRGVSNRRQSII